MGEYTDKMRQRDNARRGDWLEFSTHTQPKLEMPIETKIERIQPYFNGVDARGCMRWVGREMPRWQRELLRVPYLGDFMAYWIKRQFEDATGLEVDPKMPSMSLAQRGKNGKRARLVWGD